MMQNEVKFAEFEAGVNRTFNILDHPGRTLYGEGKNEVKHKVRPFVKWAGGKRWLIKKIDKYLPSELKNGEITRYVEPFAGGGAVFFHIFENYEIEEFVINDACKELIDTYQIIKEDVDAVIEALSEIEKEYIDCTEGEYKEYYYHKRAQFNEIKDLEKTPELASLFIFLNKASFNGIFRLNSGGKYNVPVGYHRDFAETDKDNLRAVSKALQHVKILNKDFRELKTEITKDSFVYIDPPYTVAHENNGFIEYNKKIFSWEDQKELKKFAVKMSKKGARVMISNAKHKNISELYAPDFGLYFLSRASLIGGKGSERGKIKESLILSYKIDILEAEYD